MKTFKNFSTLLVLSLILVVTCSYTGCQKEETETMSLQRLTEEPVLNPDDTSYHAKAIYTIDASGLTDHKFKISFIPYNSVTSFTMNTVPSKTKYTIELPKNRSYNIRLEADVTSFQPKCTYQLTWGDSTLTVHGKSSNNNITHNTKLPKDLTFKTVKACQP